jgi:hypothetical protein
MAAETSHMSKTPIAILSLRDVETRIKKFEDKFGVTSADFLRDEEVRAKVCAQSEDDFFNWEAAIDFRRDLKNRDEELRRDYLSHLGHRENHIKSQSPDDEKDLAA